MFELALSAGVLVHELEHAVMVRHARLPIHMIRIGTSPALLRLRFGRAWFVVRAPPFSGAMLTLVPRATTLAGTAGFLLGSIGGNAAVLAAAALVCELEPHTGWCSVLVMVAQAALIIVAAVPTFGTGMTGRNAAMENRCDACTGTVAYGPRPGRRTSWCSGSG